MFCDNFSMLRKVNGITLQDMSDIIGVTSEAVRRWEIGITVPNINTCKIISDIFKISLDELAGEINFASDVYFKPRYESLHLPVGDLEIVGYTSTDKRGRLTLPADLRKKQNIRTYKNYIILSSEVGVLTLVDEHKYHYRVGNLGRK